MEEFDYKEAIERIKAAFPPGTVQKRGDNGRAYIPNQVYTDRIEEATGSRWNREIRDVEINIPHGFVKVVARVTIGEHYRDGIGFSEIETDAGGKGKSVSNKVDQAYAEAVREALDTWQIGWKNLAPYYQEEKDWARNPALHHLLHSQAPGEAGSKSGMQSRAVVEHYCIFAKCGKQLSRDEWDFLSLIPALNREKMKFCFEHVPNHLKKKASADVLKSYEEKIKPK